MKLSIHRAIPAAAFVLHLLFIGGDCHKGVDPPPPQIEKTWHWTVDTLNYDGIGERPYMLKITSLWGSSPHDVWGTAISDIITGELWHYNGHSWTTAPHWPFSGIDSLGSYLNDVNCVIGFDSTNVFVLGGHGYDTVGTQLALRWDGHQWSMLPWVTGSPPHGMITYGVSRLDEFWTMSSTGQPAYYSGGYMQSEDRITGYRVDGLPLAIPDGGNLFFNVYQESVIANNPLGTRTMLYERLGPNHWTLLEDKFMAGGDYDGHGLGRGIWAAGSNLYTFNRSIWKRSGSGWSKSMSMDGIGGVTIGPNGDFWVYFHHELFHVTSTEVRSEQPAILDHFPGLHLVGDGWTDGTDIFIGLTNAGRDGYVLHGSLQ